MKNRLIIGLEGAVINNGNMGCVALTCSILNMLEKISKELSTPITYFVFEGEENSVKNKNICKLLQIQEEQIYSVPTKTEICYSYNREELEKRCGSRYAISHPLAELDKIDFEKTYAFIGKPCDIVALKNFMKLNPRLEKNILYTMSFFCMGLPSEKAQENLLLQLGCETNSCKDLQYRGNGWPGFTTAVDENGKNYKMDYDTSWGKILGRDLMPACRFCLDGIGEMADVACGDAWYLTESGQADFSEHAGRNVIFARTKKGLELIRKAQEKQRIETKEYNNYENSLIKIQKSQYERRIAMRARVLALKIMRKPYPVYSHKILKKYASKLTKGKQLRICLGTCKRIIKGKI